MKMIIGRKMGMTQLFKGNEVVPVTVIKAGPCYVVQKKTLRSMDTARSSWVLRR